MISNELNAEGYQQLSAVFGLLSNLWTREMTLDQLQAINEPALKDALTKLGGYVPTEINADTIEELALDYCQLLVGPKGHLSPVQSVWEDNQLGGAASSSVLKFAELLPGFTIESSLPDHLGNQLRFMSELFSRATVAKFPETYASIAQQFYDQHLRWCQPLLQQTEKKARTEFYRGLSKMTAGFLLTLEPVDKATDSAATTDSADITDSASH